MTIMRFTIGGPGGEQELAYDWAADLTAADVWALDEMGLSATVLEDFLARAESVAAGTDRDLLAGLGLRAMCAIAYLAYRRGGGDKPWVRYAAGIAPSTFTVLGMDKPPTNRAQRRAAAKGNGKATTATVGEALADAGAAIEAETDEQLLDGFGKAIASRSTR